jgi:DNA-binding NtrC family response regulator
MKRDMVEMKKILADIIQGKPVNPLIVEETPVFHSEPASSTALVPNYGIPAVFSQSTAFSTPAQHVSHHEVVVEERLSLEDQERDLISKALEKHRGRRKNASIELGISERTLYRKIKEYGINL